MAAATAVVATAAAAASFSSASTGTTTAMVAAEALAAVGAHVHAALGRLVGFDLELRMIGLSVLNCYCIARDGEFILEARKTASLQQRSVKLLSRV